MKIVEFILDRIAEEEGLAERALDHMPLVGISDDGPDEAASPIAEFIGHWNPWRVLSLCVLQRHVVMTHRPLMDEAGRMRCGTCDDPGAGSWPCASMLLLANEWADHHEFRAEWALHRRRLLTAV